MNWTILLVLSLSSCGVVQESKENKIAKTEVVQPTLQQLDISQTEIIEQINKLANDIDVNLKSYQQVDTTTFGFSSEGTGLTGYYEGSNLKKVVAKHAGETGNAIEEYYYDDGNPILVKHRMSFYEKPIRESDTTKVESVSEELFYLHNGALIIWIQGESEKHKEGNRYQEKAKQLLTSSEEYAKALK